MKNSEKTIEELEEIYEAIRSELRELKDRTNDACDNRRSLNTAAERYTKDRYQYDSFTLREISIQRLKDKKASKTVDELTMELTTTIPNRERALTLELRRLVQVSEQDFEVLLKLQ